MTATDTQPPREPLCRSADDPTQPCRFAGECNERRQRLMIYASPPIRGMACWKYQHLVGRSGSNPTATIEDPDAQLERAAIEAEG